MFNVFRVELRREWLLSKSYRLELVADQVFFILGFLILMGLFEVATGGQYTTEAKMASLIGYLVWRVAAGLMAELSDSVADDAQWGTLEQVWLSGLPAAAILFARSGVLVLYYTVRSLIMGAIILLVLRIPLTFTWADIPGAVLLYVLTLVSPFGLALVLSGLHLAFKNVNAITQPLATVLLFLTGAVVPLTGLPVLYLVSRFLPLSIGVELLRDLLVENVAFTSILASWSFVALLINSGLYLGAGLLTLHWARQKALADGSLSHY